MPALRTIRKLNKENILRIENQSKETVQNESEQQEVVERIEFKQDISPIVFSLIQYLVKSESEIEFPEETFAILGAELLTQLSFFGSADDVQASLTALISKIKAPNASTSPVNEEFTLENSDIYETNESICQIVKLFGVLPFPHLEAICKEVATFPIFTSAFFLLHVAFRFRTTTSLPVRKLNHFCLLNALKMIAFESKPDETRLFASLLYANEFNILKKLGLVEGFGEEATADEETVSNNFFKALIKSVAVKIPKDEDQRYIYAQAAKYGIFMFKTCTKLVDPKEFLVSAARLRQLPLNEHMFQEHRDFIRKGIKEGATVKDLYDQNNENSVFYMEKVNSGQSRYVQERGISLLDVIKMGEYDLISTLQENSGLKFGESIKQNNPNDVSSLLISLVKAILPLLTQTEKDEQTFQKWFEVIKEMWEQSEKELEVKQALRSICITYLRDEKCEFKDDVQQFMTVFLK